MESEVKTQTDQNITSSADGHAALLDELREQRRKAQAGGGDKRIAAQHEKGKLTARERINRLLDAGSFQEIGAYMSHRHTDFGMDKQVFLGDGMVTGFGKIAGRRVAIFAQDFTVLGGSFSEVHGKKLAKLMDTAMQAGTPVLGLNDSGGARIQEGIYSLAAFGDLFWHNSQASGVIPQISLQLGPCAGGMVYSPALTDFIIMTRDTSYMYITGPAVIKSVTGEEVDHETLGGASAHMSVSGVAHLAGDNEEHTFDLARRLLSYLPLNNAEMPPAVEPTDDPWRMDDELNTIVPLDPAEPYDMKAVVSHIFDLGTFFEIHPDFAQNALVGFARLHGQVVGVVAQQPMVLAGVIDINAADKMARFIRFCDAFNIPLFTFTDSPGFMPGVNQEHSGIIRHGAKIVFAYSEATVPKVNVVTRKAYGGAQVVMASKAIRTDLVFAWPSAEIAVMGADGAVNILAGKELARMDPQEAQAERQRMVAEYRNKFANPYAAAASGDVDDVLAPAETRPRLIAALEALRTKRASLPPKKHGNMPL